MTPYAEDLKIAPGLDIFFAPLKIEIVNAWLARTMNDLKFGSLGETWINLVRLTTEAGIPLDGEGYECLGVGVSFPATIERDRVIDRFGDPEMVAEMNRVFFAEAPNKLGHSYASLMRGPGGRGDLQDVIALLRANRWTKRAAVTFCGAADGKVPCINIVQFLVRDQAVQAMYFSRGQDAYRKFYADALCLAEMTQTVARGLELPAGRVTGFIASSHVYNRDLPAIREMLAQGRAFLRHPEPTGAT